ncbi:hypothetical protein WMF31_20430 [Sorangium sp. So ce1036]|uniref:hypothetical protein n=1 Tax=Sorangium sp. So ce1036 TaxID=3133328 RepID=UPI003F02C6A8
MKTRRSAGLVSSVFLVLGCAELDQPPRESAAVAESSLNGSRFQFIEGGSVPYVLGFSPETGQILGGSHQILIPSHGGREAIDGANLPQHLHPELQGARLKLDLAIRQGEAKTPAFASNWWPQRQNGIADRWNSANKNYSDRTSDPDNLSPVEKYDLLFHPGQLKALPSIASWSSADLRRPPHLRNPPYVQPAVVVAGPATAWELQHHGLYQGVYPEYWWGHCNGWSAYVVAEDAGPRRDIRVKRAGETVAECTAGEAGCVLFRMADIEALMSEVYFSDSVTFSGRRCETRADRTPRDVYGRPIDPACRDINPATMHIAMTGLLGVGAAPLNNTEGERQRLMFVVDHNWDAEVWSFPVKQFSIDVIEEVAPQEAARLLCNGAYHGANCYYYMLNPNARRFVRVAGRFWMISDSVTGDTLLLPPAQRDVPLSVSELHYVLELDEDLTILGGEWIKNPSIANGINGKELHPDYLWMPVRAQGAGEDSDDLGGAEDNPYISYAKVKALLKLAQRGG